MHTLSSRLVRGTFVAATLGAALSVFVACGGSNNKPTPTPSAKAPAAATAPAKASSNSKLNVPGLPADKIQAGINKAQQARQSAQKSLKGQGGQTTQSVNDQLGTDGRQDVRSLSAANGEILGSWQRITGNLLNGQLSSAEDVSVTFNADGTWAVETSGTHATGTYRSLGGHEYAVYDSSDQAGVYVAGNYLFMANKEGVVIFSR